MKLSCSFVEKGNIDPKLDGFLCFQFMKLLFDVCGVYLVQSQVWWSRELYALHGRMLHRGQFDFEGLWCVTAVWHLHKFLVTRSERISGSLLTMITFCSTCNINAIVWVCRVALFNVRSAICWAFQKAISILAVWWTQLSLSNIQSFLCIYIVYTTL